MTLTDLVISHGGALWREFARVKRDYSPKERWKEIVSYPYKNASYLNITLDKLLYDYYLIKYTEEDEKILSPFYTLCWMIIIVKKLITEYDIEDTIPPEDMEKYMTETNIFELFTRNKEQSENITKFEQYESKLHELLKEEDISFFSLLHDKEKIGIFDTIVEDKEYGDEFIDTVGNICAYDMVHNFYNKNKERDLSKMLDLTQLENK